LKPRKVLFVQQRAVTLQDITHYILLKDETSDKWNIENLCVCSGARKMQFQLSTSYESRVAVPVARGQFGNPEKEELRCLKPVSED
jgi:hypothetical protein